MALKMKIAKISLSSLIVLTLLFVFIQSMLPPEKSSAESEVVGDIIEEIIPPDTNAGQYIQINLRKIAHFVEFAILGVELSIYVLFFTKRRIFVALSYFSALFAAFIDESIQMFSGRGPAILDVWIDFFGFFVFSTVVYLIFFTVSYFLGRHRAKELQNG